MLSIQVSICARSNSQVFRLRKLGWRRWLFTVRRWGGTTTWKPGVVTEAQLQRRRLFFFLRRGSLPVEDETPSRELGMVARASLYDSKRPPRRIPSSNWFDDGFWWLTVDEISMVGDLDLSFHEEEEAVRKHSNREVQRIWAMVTEM